MGDTVERSFPLKPTMIKPKTVLYLLGLLAIPAVTVPTVLLITKPTKQLKDVENYTCKIPDFHDQSFCTYQSNGDTIDNKHKQYLAENNQETKNQLYTELMKLINVERKK